MKKLSKLFRLFVCVLLVLLVIAVTINAYVTKSAEKYMYSVEDSIDFKADCILVLGAGLKPDGSPSDMLRDRLDTAFTLYEKGMSDKLLLSGDHGRVGYDEVGTMKAYLISKGISEEAIYLDHAGFCTYDSIYRTKEIFCAEKVIIVTQKYHLFRAIYIANRLDITAIGVNSDLHTYRGQTARDAREFLARIKDFAISFIKPEPKFLGEKIPIKDSSAILTND